jgi:phosphatidate cytidylyltransferase
MENENIKKAKKVLNIKPSLEKLKNILLKRVGQLKKSDATKTSILDKIVSVFPEESRANMKSRIGTALIMIPIAIVVIYSTQWLFNIFIMTLAILMGYEWISIAHEVDKTTNKWKFLGLAYILTPCISLIYIKELPNGSDIVMWLMLVVWATDVGGMLVGRTFGGPKMAPKISPKKTWSGLAGGVVSSMLVGLLFSFAFEGTALFFAIFSGVMAVVEQISDLTESKYKRFFDVKDSGNLIPGHGGILDRVDGLTLTAPIVALITIFCRVF